MKSKIFVGVDIGGTKISAALVTDSGKIISRQKIPVPLKAPSKKIFNCIVDLIKNLLSDNNLTAKNLAGIGSGVPGIVDPNNKIIITPNIKLSGFPLAGELKKKFRTDVALGNDVNLGVLGEQWLGAGRKVKNLIGIFPGTGVGGAIIMDDQLMIGHHGAAAEVGHMIIDPKGPACTCGNRGCLEAIAGRWAIERDIRQALKKGRRTHNNKLAKGKLETIKSKVLAEGIRKKDPLILPIMKRAAETLGMACVGLRHLFDPELIILGGGLIEACGDFILPTVQNKINKDPFFSKLSRCKAVPSQLADDAVILGAVAFIKKL